MTGDNRIKFCAAFLVFAAFTAFFQIQAGRRFSWKYPPADTLVVNEYLISDLGFLFFGSRRSAADLCYIQFLQYYGSRDGGGSPATRARASLARAPLSFGSFDRPFLAGNAEGPFPRLYEIFLRLLRLDPFFRAAILEGGAVLAFNHARYDESLPLFHEALSRDPGFHRYRLYTAAVLYKIQKRDDKLLDALLDAVRYPDCPALLERVLANLLVKYGRLSEAAAVFDRIAAIAPHESDRNEAAKRSSKIRKKLLLSTHPNR